MPILGLGTDICDIRRLAQSLDKLGEKFAQRILTELEFSQYQARQETSTQAATAFLAKRWATKEAASKALGTGIAKGVSFQNFEITHDQNGKPILHLNAKALEIATALGVTSIHLSISDEVDYAMATVIFEN